MPKILNGQILTQSIDSSGIGLNGQLIIPNDSRGKVNNAHFYSRGYIYQRYTDSAAYLEYCDSQGNKSQIGTITGISALDSDKNSNFIAGLQNRTLDVELYPNTLDPALQHGFYVKGMSSDGSFVMWNNAANSLELFNQFGATQGLITAPVVFSDRTTYHRDTLPGFQVLANYETYRGFIYNNQLYIFYNAGPNLVVHLYNNASEPFIIDSSNAAFYPDAEMQDSTHCMFAWSKNAGDTWNAMRSVTLDLSLIFSAPVIIPPTNAQLEASILGKLASLNLSLTTDERNYLVNLLNGAN